MAFRFYGFSLTVGGAGVPVVPSIVVYSQGTDRYARKKGVVSSVLVQLSAVTLLSLPVDYDGFIVQRSDDMGGSWSDVSGIVRDAFFFVDEPLDGMRLYRCRTRAFGGVESAHGNEVMVTVGPWGDLDETGLQEVSALNGLVLERQDRNIPFPNGFDGDAVGGMSVGEGSLAGSFNEGSWYVETKELEAPHVKDNVPVCGSVGVAHPLTTITFTIEDLPNPGGSGIDDTTLEIGMEIEGYLGGSLLTVYQAGPVVPFAPDIQVAVIAGGDPILERDVTITLDPSIVPPLAQVKVYVTVKDLHGNLLNDVCSFTMEDADVTPPEVIERFPECNLGILAGDARRATRDTSLFFRVTDDLSGVDLSTLQVYWGPSDTGPWTQILQNGSVFLVGFTGSVVANMLNGYDVTLNRPITFPLWAPDTTVCVRVVVEDNEGNAVESICCFKVAPVVRISQVIPLRETLLFVEFSGALSNTKDLRDPSQWTLGALDGGKPVYVRSVVPQQLPASAFEDNLIERFGVGDVFAVLLEVTQLDAFKRYRLTVGDRVLDVFGQVLNPLFVDFRARRTKVDEVSEVLEGLGVGKVGTSEYLATQILTAVSRADDRIGGAYLLDDWEN